MAFSAPFNIAVAEIRSGVISMNHAVRYQTSVTNLMEETLVLPTINCIDVTRSARAESIESKSPACSLSWRISPSAIASIGLMNISLRVARNRAWSERLEERCSRDPTSTISRFTTSLFARLPGPNYPIALDDVAVRVTPCTPPNATDGISPFKPKSCSSEGVQSWADKLFVTFGVSL